MYVAGSMFEMMELKFNARECLVCEHASAKTVTELGDGGGRVVKAWSCRHIRSEFQ
jgi:hypothetical protein